jgi:hypothetical protein
VRAVPHASLLPFFEAGLQALALFLRKLSSLISCTLARQSCQSPLGDWLLLGPLTQVMAQLVITRSVVHSTLPAASKLLVQHRCVLVSRVSLVCCFKAAASAFTSCRRLRPHASNASMHTGHALFHWLVISYFR